MLASARLDLSGSDALTGAVVIGRLVSRVGVPGLWLEDDTGVAPICIRGPLAHIRRHLDSEVLWCVSAFRLVAVNNDDAAAVGGGGTAPDALLSARELACDCQGIPRRFAAAPAVSTAIVTLGWFIDVCAADVMVAMGSRGHDGDVPASSASVFDITKISRVLAPRTALALEDVELQAVVTGVLRRGGSGGDDDGVVMSFKYFAVERPWPAWVVLAAPGTRWQLPSSALVKKDGSPPDCMTCIGDVVDSTHGVPTVSPRQFLADDCPPEVHIKASD